MAEGTIKDLVQIQSGYTSYVNLRQDLFDDSRNIGRMSRYRPIASHRRAFQELAKSLNVNDGRCYLLTGSYGTGKSHLCLMFANYLQTPSGEKPMPDFFKHYTDQDRHAAEDLKLKRSSGRYLVALCEWGGKEDFDEIVLRAVDDALSREGFGDDFDTHYLQAVKRIEDWQAFSKTGEGVRSRFHEELERELADQSTPLTVNGFKKRLKAFDHQALDEFRRIHSKLTSSPFTHDKADLGSILTHALKSKKFKERFQGILVLFDEFGDTMERGNLSPTAFQRFAELCSQTPQGSGSLVFVSTAHRALTDYAKPYQAVDFRKVSDRVKEVPLTADGVEEIIGAIVVPKKTDPLWQKTVEPRSDEFDALLNDCVRLRLFDWLSAPKIRTAIIENIFPDGDILPTALGAGRGVQQPVGVHFLLFRYA